MTPWTQPATSRATLQGGRARAGLSWAAAIVARTPDGGQRPGTDASARYRRRSDGGLHLHDVPGRQVLRPRPAGPGEHLAVVPSRREDRRPGAERRRQVDVAPDHGAARGTVLR